MNFKKIDIKNIDLTKLKRKRSIYLMVFIVLAGILIWAFIAAGIITRNFNRQQIVGKGNRQELDISSIILTETKGDKKYWEIYGETGYYNSDNKIAMLNNVTGNFYSNNEVSMSFESSKGTYNEEKKEIILYNNTHIVIKDGTSLYCDKLVWSGSDKDIIATGNIKIVRGTELIAKASKAVISPDYAKFKIIGKTSTRLYQKEKK